MKKSLKKNSKEARKPGEGDFLKFLVSWLPQRPFFIVFAIMIGLFQRTEVLQDLKYGNTSVI